MKKFSIYNRIKTQKGITLIALIITIVVLLILAVVSITAITEQDLFGEASAAANAYENGAARDNHMMTNSTGIINSYLHQFNNVVNPPKGE